MLQALFATRLDNYDRDRLFCFGLGFLPVGLFMGCLNLFVETIFDVICNSHSPHVARDSLGLFAQYGISGGMLGLLLARLLRNFRTDSSWRWVWLALIVPECSFLLAAVGMFVSESLCCRDFWSKPSSLEDCLAGLSVYLAAGVASGLAVIVTLGTWKLVRMIARKHSSIRKCQCGE